MGMIDETLPGQHGEPDCMPGDHDMLLHSAGPSLQALEIHIEELILHGVAPVDRARLVAAVERGLTRLLATQGIPSLLAQEREIASLDSGMLALQPGETPETLGARITWTVYRGLRE